MTTSPPGQVAGIGATPGALTGAAMPGVAPRAAIAAELAVTASSRRMAFIISPPKIIENVMSMLDPTKKRCKGSTADVTDTSMIVTSLAIIGQMMLVGTGLSRMIIKPEACELLDHVTRKLDRPHLRSSARETAVNKPVYGKVAFTRSRMASAVSAEYASGSQWPALNSRNS